VLQADYMAAAAERWGLDMVPVWVRVQVRVAPDMAGLLALDMMLALSTVERPLDTMDLAKVVQCMLGSEIGMSAVLALPGLDMMSEALDMMSEELDLPVLDMPEELDLPALDMMSEALDMPGSMKWKEQDTSGLKWRQELDTPDSLRAQEPDTLDSTTRLDKSD
jgi:hypothetical protein